MKIWPEKKIKKKIHPVTKVVNHIICSVTYNRHDGHNTLIHTGHLACENLSIQKYRTCPFSHFFVIFTKNSCCVFLTETAQRVRHLVSDIFGVFVSVCLCAFVVASRTSVSVFLCLFVCLL